MYATGLRRVAVLLLSLALLAAAAPAAAAADRSPREEPAMLQTLADWIAGLFPGEAPTPERTWASLGPADKPDGAGRGAAEGPTVEPQLGANPDPDG